MAKIQSHEWVLYFLLFSDKPDLNRILLGYLSKIRRFKVNHLAACIDQLWICFGQIFPKYLVNTFQEGCIRATMNYLFASLSESHKVSHANLVEPISLINYQLEIIWWLIGWMKLKYCLSNDSGLKTLRLFFPIKS